MSWPLEVVEPVSPEIVNFVAAGIFTLVANSIFIVLLYPGYGFFCQTAADRNEGALTNNACASPAIA